METVFLIVCIFILLIILILQKEKFDNELRKIVLKADERKTHTDMKLEEINASISNIKTELMNNSESISTGVESSNTRFNDVNNQVKNIIDLIEEMKMEIEESSESKNNFIFQQIENIDDKIVILAESIRKILVDSKKLRKELEFYTEIQSDSTSLNDSSATDEQEQLLEKALHEITDNKKDIQAKSEIKTKNTIQKGDPVEVISAKESADENAKKTIAETNNTGDENERFSVLDPEQKAAFDLMQNTRQNIFITGKAGTGKSFLLKLFVKATTKRVILLAPTGIAAINIQGATIHSAFGYENLVNLNVDDISFHTIKLKSEKRQLLKAVDVIIIDEISMVRSDTFEKIDKILRVLNKSEVAFGGKQVIIFGDLFQLPPIAKADEIKYLQDTFGGVYFFYSNTYLQGNFKFVELSINHRQKDDTSFFEILNRIREGNVSKSDLKVLNSRANFDREQIRRTIRLFSTKANAESVNRSELEKINSKEYVYQSKLLYSKNNMMKNFEAMFPVTETLKLKLGALVMLVVNDTQKR